MDSTTPAGIRETYKSAFLKGLAAILPTLITVWVLAWAYGTVKDNIATPINDAIKTQLASTETGRQFAVRRLGVDPKTEHHPEQFAGALTEAFPDWVGFVVAVVLCFAIGFFVASFIGRRLWAAAEASFHRMPIVRAIYPAAKQVADFFIPSNAQTAAFSRVGLVPFPAEGQWSIGLVMSDGLRDLDQAMGKRHLPIFVPMSPTPVTGFVCMVPEDQFIGLDMSVDEAFKFYITCGLAIPDRLRAGAPLPAPSAAPSAASPAALPASAATLPAAAPAG